MHVKICGIKDQETLKYLITHRHKPKFIGFISNYKKSHRYLDLTSLKKLMNINKKGVNFVAVLVKPKITFLEKIKSLPFDYYQLYDVSPSMTRLIKKKYQIKIISSITIKKFRDIQIYKKYENISDILLFDSKGYEKSKSFDHNYLKKIKPKKKIMVAGNIKHNDKLDKFKKMTDIIDISGGLETNRYKDRKKIDLFLNNVNKL